MSEKSRTDFEQLYKDNYQKVYRLALGLTGTVTDAEEVTQEAFLRAFRAYDTYRGDSSFFTWIYRITLNISNDYLKQRKRMPIHALVEDLGYDLEQIIDRNPANNPEYEMLAKEARYKCLHCLTECMPAEQRKVFCLAVTLGMPYKKVAEIMECSIAKVKSTMHRAKKRWFGYMEDRCELINRANPCTCRQWVKFGLEQGWIVNTPEVQLKLESNYQSVEEVRKLRMLQNIYSGLYPDKTEKDLIDRIKNGIKRKEWAILS